MSTFYFDVMFTSSFTFVIVLCFMFWSLWHFKLHELLSRNSHGYVASDLNRPNIWQYMKAPSRGYALTT